MPERLTKEQLAAVAKEWGLTYAHLSAVKDVESGPHGGFLPDGQCVILFEPHVLYRRLQIRGRGIDPAPLQRDLPTLCYPKWKTHPYGATSAQWPKVLKVIAWAQKRDPERWESYKKAAYESCSWGMFQLMGHNYSEAGFPNVYDFVHAHRESEAEQLKAILAWMSSNGLIARLKRCDWYGFARTYNGPGAVETYGSKLASAYARYV